MEQQDYLMKQIEQFGLVLGKILSKLLNLKDSSTESTVAVNKIFTEELDFDVNQLKDINEDKWFDTLKTEKQLNSENLEKLADILLFAAKNVNLNEKNQLYQKCLIIYQYLEESEKIYSFERNHKINIIKHLIEK